MESYERCWLDHCVPKKFQETRCNGRAGERDEVHNTLKPIKKESMRSHLKVRITQIRNARNNRNWERKNKREEEVVVQKFWKITRRSSSSLHQSSECENRWIRWMILETFKMWNQITVGDCLTFPVSPQWFLFSTFDSPRGRPRRNSTWQRVGRTKTIHTSEDGTIPMPRLRKNVVTIPREINSNDFVFFSWITEQIRIRFPSLRISRTIRFLVVFKDESLTTSLYMCMCCGFLCPQCIHDDNFWNTYFFARDVAKNMKRCGKSKASLTEHHGKYLTAQIVRNTWFLSSFSVSLSVCLNVLCVFVRGEGERLIGPCGPKNSLKIAGIEQPYQVNRIIGGIGDMLFSIFSQTCNG